jgi:hypothetical protein
MVCRRLEFTVGKSIRARRKIWAAALIKGHAGHMADPLAGNIISNNFPICQ